MIGRRLSHFKITGRLGEGGMGEVYRAQDTKLGREVALKVLPEAVSADPQRMARFDREARVVASLNHPSIAAVYAVEHEDSLHFLVMELAEGQDLARRIARGPIPLGEALTISLQIAEALEFAHEKGIVHRDLKPANVMLGEDAAVKVLDFGLAKAIGDSDSNRDVELSSSSTLPAPMTQHGIILGTAGYMSPEQARGSPVDKRTDIWAFGVVLYEMLAGKRLFDGPALTDVLAAVMRDEIYLDNLPPGVPSSIRRLLARCLDRDPKSRLRDVGEARIAIDGVLSGEETADDTKAIATVPIRQASPWWPTTLLTGAAGIALGALLVWSTVRSSPTTPTVKQLDLFLDPVPAIGDLALTSDGKTLIYVGHENGENMLYRRDLDGFRSQVITGTEGASDPFVSPDDQQVGFFTPGRLKRVGLSGGLPVVVCNTEGEANGAVWTDDQEIIFATAALRIPHRVRVDEGGEAEPVQIEALEAGMRMRAPRYLPGAARSVLVTVTAPSLDGEHIGVLDLDSGRWQTLVRGVDARLLPTGFLVFAQDGRVVSAPFDIHRLEVSAPERSTTLEGAAIYTGSVAGGRFNSAVAADGTLMYPVGEFGHEELYRLSREGVLQPLGLAANNAVVGAKNDRLLAWDAEGVLSVDLREGDRILRPLLERGAWYPRWLPGEERIVFSNPLRGEQQLLEGVRGLFEASSDGTEISEVLSRDVSVIATSVGPDGTIMGYQIHPDTRRDVFTLSPEGDFELVVQTRHNERAGTISPDGQWFAFVSDEEDGVDQVFARSMTKGGRRWKVSSEGGWEPVWSRDGSELFYRHGNRLLAAPVTRSGSALRVGRPQLVLEDERLIHEGFGNPAYDSAPDGSLVVALGEPSSVRVRVVLNWVPGDEPQ